MSSRPPEDASEVGYRKPPKKNRFKKGHSGNPRGRPRRSVNRSTVLLQTLHEHVLAEAERLITVTEGDTVMEIPIQAALVKTMAARALKGDSSSVRQFQSLLEKAQAKRSEFQLKVLQTAVDYKEFWGPVFAKCEREGLPPPDQLPHPDDLHIDFERKELTILGPQDENSRLAYEALLAQRDTWIEQLEDVGRLSFTKPELRATLRRRQLKKIEEINCIVPARFRRTYHGPIEV